MNKKLAEFIKSLDILKSTIEHASFTENSFDQQHGWNQVHLHQEDISTYISNFIAKLNNYGDAELTEGLDSTIEGHHQNIQRLNATATTYFTNNASHLLHITPSIILTLSTIFSDIEYELFSFENIQEKKLLPKNLSARLRSTKNQIDSLGKSSLNLIEKVAVIHDAHEAAESLPTDLASLQEAKSQLDSLISSATKDLANTKKGIDNLKSEAISLRDDVKRSEEEAKASKAEILKYQEEASKLVAQCDDALQITTTQGLAAGFDQKAKELKNSIWVWIVGLLIALVTGAIIGAERVTALTMALDNELTVGQVLLHTIMSIFSIGGSLWLAWISTQQINQRFKLSEDYSYKATVAKAFTGFRKFAERFDNETEERLFNSTLDRLDEMPLRLIEGKDYNSPWHEFIDSDAFKKSIEIIPSLAKEAGRFASKTKLKDRPKKPIDKTENNPSKPKQESVPVSDD